MKKNYYIISNPISGNQRSKKILPELIKAFSSNNKKYIIKQTEYPGHAIQLCQKLDFNLYTNIIAVGGDGTFHEVINGMMINSNIENMPTLGFFPAGTGNAFMHDLKATIIKKAIKKILDENTKKIDLMKLEYNDRIEYALNIVGWGLVSDILKLSEKIRFLGGIRYTLASLYCIFNKKSRYAKIVINNVKKEGNYLFILNLNTIHTGKGMKAAPNAILDDGYIDSIILENNLSRLQLLLLMLKIFKGTHITSKFVQYKQIKKLKINPTLDGVLNIDGELKGETPVSISVLCKKLKIIC